MPLWVEQAAIVMLAVDFDRHRAKVAKHARWDCGATDEGSASAVTPGGPAENQRLTGIRIDPLFFEQSKGRVIGWKLDLGGDSGAVLTGPDQGGVGARAQRQPKRIEKDGFAGAGFSGQNPKPRLELELEPLDQYHIVDREML